ncbi:MULTISPECIES: ATP-binding protein [unclassified Polaribacter]|uniref:ATP-binding protein n=1 Tax=unclassified Polaribacter TaxID=196858 RepID=UPI0011BF7590|nr:MULTISPECIES: ATP-binding protein [unclassified Polaribacter]TXD50794.1 hypothetical protein ES043_14610 [Polaribacter sp. IC063]TXD57550.1 hypothetical protein ES044_14865 [Polaribacter sp. IC066]
MNLKNINVFKLHFLFFLICSFSYAQNSKIDSAYFYFKKGEKFDFENKHFKAYENYIKSKLLYQKLTLEDSLAKCHLKLFDLINSQNNLNEDSKPYLDAYHEYALHKKDSALILDALYLYGQYFYSNQKKSIAAYKQILKFIDRNERFSKSKFPAYINIANLYITSSKDSAELYFKKGLKSIDKKNKEQLLGYYINYANFFEKQSTFKEAIVQLKKAEVIKLNAYQLKYDKIIFGKFANCYQKIGDYKNAYKYYEKYNITRDRLNNTEQNIAISDLDKKYQTAEKDALILETETRRLKNRNFLIVSILVLILVSIIAILTLKNSRRKRKLAEQEAELETQKNLTFLKEQEITTINAMVDGQEKERKRIAEDLHDNLGSVLATLKLHFENLKINREKQKINQETLFDKTENLIDEAYLKVRSIAHAKNAGVIANQGLLLAVQMMAEKISSANKIKIEVIDFGLDQRLDNSLELTTFRVIQELITNIIKHANAKNATIHISLYDKNLNIIVEDDGIGFDIKKINLKNSMGISSIQTRIEYLKGTFNVDSTLHKGASIIIDIPVL